MQAQVHALEAAGADMLHVDIMDGNFVPNITMGAMFVKALRAITTLPLDCHLMVQQPERHIDAFAEAGADIITFHIETTAHADRLISQIHSHNKKAGIALCPATPHHALEYLYEKIDLALVMTVNPGAGGQPFLAAQVAKITAISEAIAHRQIMLQADGGINTATAQKVVQAGANVLVAGQAIMHDQNLAQNIKALRVVK